MSPRHARVKQESIMTGSRPLAAVVAALALAGCKDSGLPGMNLPLQVAEHKPTPYVLYTPAAASGQRQVLEMDGEHWLLTSAEEAIPDALLGPAGAAGEGEPRALAWDSPPYDRLYQRTPEGRYRSLVRIPRVDPAAARTAAPGADPGH
jgi:hypothetical protein